MKYIFDFDDVLFNTKDFKGYIFSCLEEFNITKDAAEQYYIETRVMDKPFSLKEFLFSILKYKKIEEAKAEEIYEKVMSECKNYVNGELIEIVKKLGRDNSYLVTNGDEKFQQDKIDRCGVTELFSEIHIVPGSKAEIIYDICSKNKDEEVLFIDDKQRFFDDLDSSKCPNLKTILYTGQDLSVI